MRCVYDSSIPRWQWLANPIGIRYPTPVDFLQHSATGTFFATQKDPWKRTRRGNSWGWFEGWTRGRYDDEGEEFVAGNALRIGGPIAPAVGRFDGGLELLPGEVGLVFKL
jgi:hypothetical protein